MNVQSPCLVAYRIMFSFIIENRVMFAYLTGGFAIQPLISSHVRSPVRGGSVVQLLYSLLLIPSGHLGGEVCHSNEKGSPKLLEFKARRSATTFSS